MKLHPVPSLLLALGAVVLSATLAGCGTAGDGAGRGSAGDPAESASVETSAVQVGDCRLEAASGLPADAEIVSCDEQHDEEVFHSIEMPEGAFSAEAVEAASAECIGEPFTAFVGVRREESALGVYTIPPTIESWDQPGGRIVYCVLLDPAGPVRGSLAGAAR